MRVPRDPRPDEGAQGPSLPEPRHSGGSGIVGDVLHYYGGGGPDGDSGVHWAYDLSQASGWQVRAPLPVPRNHIGATTLNGALYAIGGQFGGNEANGNRPEVQRYNPGNDTWTGLADLPAGRGHTTASTFVLDGRVVVAGGAVNGNAATSSVVTYDPATNVWVKLPSLPSGRGTPVTDAIGGAIVSSTGNGGDGPSAVTWSGVLARRWEVAEPQPVALGEVSSAVIGRSLFVVGEGNPATLRYDLATGTWDTRASRPFVGDHHAAEVFGGELYLFGGLGGGAEGKVQIYNPTTNVWRTGADMPFAAGSSASARIGTAVYVAGGIVGNATTRQAAKYDPALNKWTAIAPMPFGRNHAASGTGGQTFYVFGGRGPGSGDGNVVANGFDTVQRYNPATNTWQTSEGAGATLARLPQARGGMGKAVYHKGAFYVMGGETLDGAGATSQHVYRRVDVYNAAANSWSQGTPMPTARHGIYPALLAGRIYVAAGGTQSGPSRSSVLEVYNPG